MPPRNLSSSHIVKREQKQQLTKQQHTQKHADNFLPIKPNTFVSLSFTYVTVTKGTKERKTPAQFPPFERRRRRNRVGYMLMKGTTPTVHPPKLRVLSRNLFSASLSIQQFLLFCLPTTDCVTNTPDRTSTNCLIITLPLVTDTSPLFIRCGRG